MRRLASILLWSVIAAAFIGPGTVTTAGSAGASTGLTLLWALVFSTVACFVLQEASARLTAVSGQSLGQALRARYKGGVRALFLILLVLGAIVLGCAAFEAGNILGGVAGALLISELSPRTLAVLTTAAAGVLLWFQAPHSVARILSLVVAVMGIAFVATAWGVHPEPVEVLKGSLMPRLPAGSTLLAIGLVGTTVVPYNIFLGSGLARGERLADVRLGLAVAIGLGGLISMAVLIVGTAVPGEFSFESLATILDDRLGAGSRTLFGVGLLGAGLSSAITAPLAAAVTARDLLGRDESDTRWSMTSWRYRGVWGLVLAAGLGFGMSGVRPVPAILLAQGFNGVLLPLVAVFLFLAINDGRLMGDRVNGLTANLVTGCVVMITMALGLAAVLRSAATVLEVEAPGAPLILGGALLVTGAVGLAVAKGRRWRAD